MSFQDSEPGPAQQNHPKQHRAPLDNEIYTKSANTVSKMSAYNYEKIG